MVVEQKLGDNTTVVLCFIVRSTRAPSTSSENRNGPKCLLVKCYWLLIIVEKGPFSHLKMDTLLR